MHFDHNARMLNYLGYAVACRKGESVLDAFLRAGVNIPFSCKSGVCHRCMIRCIDGEIPLDAKRKLPEHQQAAGCLLACQCHPTGPMVLAPRSPENMVTRCLLHEIIRTEDNRWRLLFEPITSLKYRTAQLAQIMSEELTSACTTTFLSSPDEDFMVTVELEENANLPDWLQLQPLDKLEFCLRGPLPVEPSAPVIPLPPEPYLWDELGGDAIVRAVLTSFYEKVYADPELRPFFERVTMDRIIGKQFAFMKENIQGDQVFLGEQPRNAHNWMVITDTLFDHRQSLMLQAMRAHGLTNSLIARWACYEEQFRPDVVKYKPWLKQIGDQWVDTEQYEVCLLEEATVCDYCEGEIPTGKLVRYHKRIGKIGCEACVSTTTLEEQRCQP